MARKKKKKKEDTITISKTALWQLTTGVLAVLLVVSIFTQGFNFGGLPTPEVNDNPPQPTGNNQPEPQPQPSAQVSASDFVDDDAVLGDDNAPLTIVEFSDYQCPFCRRFWTQTLPQVKEQYIDTGQVKLVYRDFPLTNIHPMAQKAAEAAECVRDQGGDDAYFEMHDKLFQEQNVLDGGDPDSGPVRSTVQFSTTDLKDWALDLGYDISDCLDSGQFADEVQQDLRDAQAAGGRGTPYFIVGSTPVSGAQPFQAFQAAIEAELG